MGDQNRDDFYEGPPIEAEDRWHDGAVFEPQAEPATAGVASPPGQPTVDPSLSRAVDRDAAGVAPEAEGYDRGGEGPAPGPLEPEVGEHISPDLPSGSV